MGGHADVAGDLDALVGGHGRDQPAEVLKAQGRVEVQATVSTSFLNRHQPSHI